MKMKILVTGCLGFIGMHLSNKLTQCGIEVVGIDQLINDDDLEIKKLRYQQLKDNKLFKYINGNLCLDSVLDDSFANLDFVIHLAGKPGVRDDKGEPKLYFDRNIVAHFNVLEFCRANRIKLIYASSSSVYGEHNQTKSNENDELNYLTSIYASSKKSAELLSDAYSFSYDMQIAGLRFFTVYGEYGRPDMAYWIFTKKVLSDNPISVYGDGSFLRDFTYIDTVTDAIYRLIKNFESIRGHELFNIGNNDPRSINELISIISHHTKKRPNTLFEDKNKFDVSQTTSNNEKIESLIGALRYIKLEDGLKIFIDWFKKNENFYN